jgi:hypothetical protein
VINEALTHTDPPAVDTIELYNPTASPADLSGWFLTDDHAQPMKYRITNTIVPANGYVLFTENQFNAGGTNAFALASLGDEVYLFSGDGTNLGGYRHGFEFGAQSNGVTFGRHVTSDGAEHFVTQQANTLGAANAGPRVGPIVINEIMYAPPPFGSNADTLDEYIELRNITAQPAPLFDPLHPTNAWRLDGGVQFTFPLGVTLAPLSHLLVVNFDPDHDPVMLNWFRARYGVSTNTPLFGPYQGNLSNGGERVALDKPDKPEVPPSPIAGFVPYVLVEEVNYSNQLPWPVGADSTGNSLQRIAGVQFADDPANWQAGAPTAGRLNQGADTADTDHDGLPDEWELSHGFDPKDATGVNGALGDPYGGGASIREEYIAGTDPHDGQDYLRLDRVTLNPPYCVIEFNTRTGHTYTVESAAVLGATNLWAQVGGVINGNDSPATVYDQLDSSARFYRLKVTRN